jgi:hypothetical protein
MSPTEIRPTAATADVSPVRARLARILDGTEFPALSRQIIDTLSALDDDANSLQRLANVVLREYSLTLSVVKTANSVHYRRGAHPIQSATHALMMLGARTVRQLAGSLLLFENYSRKSPELKELMLLSLLTASLGMAMTILPTLTADDSASHAGQRWLGVVLGLGTAAIYGLYVLFGSVLGKRWNGPLQSSFIVMSSAAAMFLGVALVQGDRLPNAAGAWIGAVTLALVGSVIAITALLAGLAILGPVKTSALSLVEPLSTVVVGAIFLNEPLAPVQLAGGALILVGAGMAVKPSKSEAAAAAATNAGPANQ